MEAATRELEGFKGFKAFEAWQTAGLNALTREGYVQAKGRLQCWNADGQELGCAARDVQAKGRLQPWNSKGLRQRAGCNPGTAKADGQRAWWQLPRGSSAAVGGGSCREGVGGF